MKIAVSATGTGLEAAVDPRFGRCRYFVVSEPETMDFEDVENSATMAGGGSGIAAAQIVTSKGAGAVLTGSCGPNAYQVLEAAGVKVFTGVTGTVRSAVESYKAGRLANSTQPDISAHFGRARGRHQRGTRRQK